VRRDEAPANAATPTSLGDGSFLDVEVDIEERFQWLRAETLQVLLIALAAVMWLATVPYLANPDDFWPGWGASVLLLLVILACYAIRERSYYLASGLLIFSLVAIVTARTFSGIAGDGATPFLYIPVVLVAGTLLRARVAVLVALVASATLLALELVGRASLGITTDLQILVAIWLTALISWLTKRNLYTTLHWYWHSQQEATKSLEEARRHRGELASTLKQLADATYRLERMNYALNWARLDAEQARRMKAQFAAHVSHELRTPINLVVGFSDMMLNVPQAYGGAPLPLAYQTDLQTLHRSATHLQGMIDDILDLSQLDARAMPLLRENVGVAGLIDEAVATIRQLLERKNLAIDVEVAPSVTTAYLDPLRIRQVLLNLLSNASRHTIHGGITIRGWREGDDVVITVADTGEGIDPREIDHLFEAFHRLAPSPTGVHEGWGLGLAICREFIELHQGTIGVASDGIPGLGTTFTLRLPIQPRAVESPTPGDSPGHLVDRLVAVTPAANVVVLDSDPHVHNLCRRYLKGYQVYGAAEEGQALALARSVGAHALLVNATSVLTSPEWQQKWSSLSEQQGLRVVGFSLPSGQKLALLVGLSDFLIKPVTREALLAAVQAASPLARTIAVIDDAPPMVRLLTRMLRSSGKRWRILRAYAGAEGLELVKNRRPDVVLLDLLLPQLAGFAVLEAIRADPSLAGVAVIAVSAQDASEVLPLAEGRALSLISDRGLTLSQTLHGVQQLLDFLPPAGSDRPEFAPAPEAAPVASGACE
jgi:signal transduction histidine kinase/CheY-like chemotaxis protein